MNKVVRKCRGCRKEFEQTVRPRIYKMSAAEDAYVLHSYCERCRQKIKRRYRECDPRYSGVGGHGDVLEAAK